MGQTLSEPVTAKESAYCQNDNYRVGSSCMQGWRLHMEDSHTHILSLPDDPGTSFFAVYDGHGGENIAQFAGRHLHKYITKQPEYRTNIEEGMKKVRLYFFVFVNLFVVLYELDLDYLDKEGCGGAREEEGG